MFKSTLVGFAALATVVITGQSPSPGPSQSPNQLDSLSAVFAGPHAALRDTNGDGLNDAVVRRQEQSCRCELPAALPTP